MNVRMLKNKFVLTLFLLAISLGVNAETIKILAIGNSFSEDAVENYLYNIGKADGVEFVIGNLFIGGCSLETHWTNADKNNASYDYRKIVNGVKTSKGSTTMETGITDENWDYISFQQASPNSGQYDTFFPYLTSLLAYVKTKATNSNVKYIFHSTWAYQQNSTHSGFANYNKDQMTMFNAIVDASNRAATEAGINIVVPAGTAIQNARTSFLGDNLCRDGYHLDVNIGRFTAACTWYEKLTGKNILNNSYAPASITDINIEVAHKSAHSAVQTPLKVTNIEVEQEKANGDFMAWNITKTGHGGMNGKSVPFSEKNLTLETWLYIDETDNRNVSGVNVISTRHTGNQGFSINLNTNSATGLIEPRFVFKNSKNDGASDQAFALFLPRAEFSNQWAHLAFVISSEEHKAYAYLNGEIYDVLEDFYTDWVGNRASGDDMWIGYWYNGQVFYGKMAELRVWNVARSAEEIAENYNKRLTGSEDGLYVYYNFDSLDQNIVNVANPGTNNGTLLPAATWKDSHSIEVLSSEPTNLAIADKVFTWEGDADSFAVEVVEKANGDIIYTDETEENSYDLTDLDLKSGKEYEVKVRAKTSFFYSDWASIVSDGYNGSGINDETANGFYAYSKGGVLVICSDNQRLVNIYSIEGRLMQTINLQAGETVVEGLSKGFYLVNNSKVIVK